MRSHEVVYDSPSGFTFLANVSDSEHLGVYLVAATPPATIGPGLYNLTITLADETVPTPLVEILPAPIVEGEFSSSDKAIEFDEEKVTDENLLAFDHRLNPVSLNCDTEWSKTLPPIKGDRPGVTIDVNLGGAEAFVRWNPLELTFVHEPLKTEFEM